MSQKHQPTRREVLTVPAAAAALRSLDDRAVPEQPRTVQAAVPSLLTRTRHRTTRREITLNLAVGLPKTALAASSIQVVAISDISREIVVTLYDAHDNERPALALGVGQVLSEAFSAFEIAAGAAGTATLVIAEADEFSLRQDPRPEPPLNQVYGHTYDINDVAYTSIALNRNIANRAGDGVLRNVGDKDVYLYHYDGVSFYYAGLVLKASNPAGSANGESWAFHNCAFAIYALCPATGESSQIMALIMTRSLLP